MLITSTMRCALPVSLFGTTPLPVVRDRHAGWRGTGLGHRRPGHISALARPTITERYETVHRAAKRDPLVPRPRAELG